MLAALGRGALLIAVYSLLGKAIGAAKEILLARQFGVGAEFDAYAYLLRLYSIPGALTLSIMTLVLTPQLIRLEIDAARSAERFANQALGATLALGLLVASALHLATPFLLAASAPAPAVAAIVAKIGPPMVALIPFSCATGLLSAWLMARRSHAVTLLESVPALTIAVALLAIPTPDIVALSAMTLAGMLLHAALAGGALRAHGARVRPAWGFDAAPWPAFLRAIAVIAAGQACMSLTTIVDQYFVAGLPTGALSTLTYAERLLAFFTSLVGLIAARLVLPFLAGDVGDLPARRRATLKMTAIATALGFVFAASCLVFAEPLVGIVLQRGAFTAADTTAVAQLLRWLALQLPFYLGGLTLYAALAAAGRYREMALTALLCLVLKTAAAALLVGRFGLTGIALSSVAMYGFFFFALLLRLSHSPPARPAPAP